MQNTYQEKSLDPIDKDFLFGKKLEGGIKLSTVSDFKPAGDQPEAIKKLISGINSKKNDQVLLGVTGSGKTFSMAKIIEALNRPALILAPNKTLAAQLYGEMKTFFPNNAVEYFVSYYDYYTPEAYVPRSDTYIEKEASINEQIDRMRHSATRSLLERDDVIIVASVSCIYGLGSVESYSKMTLGIKKNHEHNREQIIKTLVNLQYKRNDQNFHRGTFRVRGDNLEIFPSHLEDRAWRISLFGNKVEKIYAKKELILSGGSINSPQLLMLSGIGDANHLKEKGIKVIQDLKGVGRNLQDHLETYIQQECKTSDTLYKYTKLVPKVLSGIQWFLSKSGPCSHSFLEAGGFAKSSNERKISNIQFHFFPSFVIDHGLVAPSSHGYQLHASPNHPKSRGSVTLSSSNPYDYPKILFNYLEHEDDLKQTRECIHVARKILSQPALKPYSGKEVGPGTDAQSDGQLNEYIRSNSETAYHPCGTLKMGIDKMAVVDENLKIHGLKNIRVVDASVIPEIPSANLNAPTLMIAEKASDIITKTV